MERFRGRFRGGVNKIAAVATSAFLIGGAGVAAACSSESVDNALRPSDKLSMFSCEARLNKTLDLAAYPLEYQSPSKYLWAYDILGPNSSDEWGGKHVATVGVVRRGAPEDHETPVLQLEDIPNGIAWRDPSNDDPSASISVDWEVPGGTQLDSYVFEITPDEKNIQIQQVCTFIPDSPESPTPSR